MPIPTPDASSDHPVAPTADQPGAESRTAPGIPSFASLRDPRRRTAIGVLVPPTPTPTPTPAPAPAAESPVDVPPIAGASVDAPPAAGQRAAAGSPSAGPSDAASPAGVRPPEWPDLWRLGVHVGRTVAGVPVRVVLWKVRCLRTLLGR